MSSYSRIIFVWTRPNARERTTTKNWQISPAPILCVFFNSIQLERLCVYRSCVKVCQLRLLLIHAQQFKHCLAVNGFGRQSSGVLFGVWIHYEVCMDFSFSSLIVSFRFQWKCKWLWFRLFKKQRKKTKEVVQVQFLFVIRLSNWILFISIQGMIWLLRLGFFKCYFGCRTKDR